MAGIDDPRAEAVRPPYWRVWRLIHWIAARSDYIRGSLLRQGVDPYALDGGGLLDVGWSYLVDGFPLSNREQIIKHLCESMDETPVPDEETWGMSEAEIARAERLYAEVGGPAPVRPKDAPVPEAVRRAREQLGITS